LFDNAGGGALVGDYDEQDIQAIQADVFIDSIDALDFIDCAIFACFSDSLTVSLFPPSLHGQEAGGNCQEAGGSWFWNGGCLVK